MRSVFALGFGLGGALLLLPETSFAAQFSVTTTSGGNGVPACTNDVANPKTNCNLTEALKVAADTPEDDTITLAAGTGGNYSTANAPNATQAFAALSIDGSSITVVGAGIGKTVLDGGGQSAVLAVGVGLAGNVVFRDLSIKNGGTGGLGGSVDSGTLTVERVELANNLAGKRAGGGVFTSNSGTVIVKDCIITGNTGAAASFANGVELQSNFNGKLVFTGNKVLDNVSTTASMGGVRFLNISGGVTMEIENNLVTGNSALDYGGMGIDVYFTSGPVLVANNVIANNKSTGSGAKTAGGFAFSDDTAPVTVDFIGNTLVGNSAVKSGGGAMFYVALAPGSSAGTTNVYNNVFFGNSAPAGTGQDLVLRANANTSPQFKVNANVESEVCFTSDGTTLECNLANAPLVTTAGEVHGDPLFVNAAAGDFRLGIGSPAIDVGDSAAPRLSAKDFTGGSRIVGPKVDIGAIEARGDVGIEPASVDFGEVALGETKSQVVTISNKGAGLLTASAPAGADAPFSVDVNGGASPCGNAPSLASGKTCTVTIAFAPAIAGTFESALSVDSDDADSPKSTLTVKGTGAGAGSSGSNGSSSGDASSGALGVADANHPEDGCALVRGPVSSSGAFGASAFFVVLGIALRRSTRRRTGSQ